MEYEKLRALMVSNQLIPRGINDRGVLDAMGRVPRHLFVPEELQHKAYDDMALQIGEGQTISQPYMVAIMTQLLELGGTEKVLEVGTGSGYQSAILAELSKDVCTIERFESLSDQARERITSLGYGNVHFMVGDGTMGWPSEAPFDRILITAGAPRIPDALKEQLSDGGIILAPVGSIYSQELVKSRKKEGKFHDQFYTPCVFVPLVGKYGWEES
jgi:protein-L-isoaspartate(D-aspartate) O-methyltransferase